jgi:hypothetical protein
VALAGAAPGLDAERVVGPDVSSCAIDDGARLLLFDPLSVPEELLELAADREPVVLTAPWHERDTQSLVGRLACRCSCRRPTLQTTMCGSRRGEADLYAAGDRLPIGIKAFPGREHNDLVLWIESRRAVVAGDALVDFGRGLEIRQESLTRALRASRSSKDCGRCSCRRSRSCSRRTEHRQTVLRSSARSPDSESDPPIRRACKRAASRALAYLTVSDAVTAWESVPLVPVTTRVTFPRAVEDVV